ncbi:hypothetical protein Slala03_30380 [Streptomyces lavendulae subsp. lavendulae]|nr:hypothetical protein Slala03_30380 [Streptomyces lavendulae subsp. lavendulae]
MSQSTDPAGQIAAGYAFTGPALDLGALLWEGTCLPDRQIRIPLSMLNRHGTAWSPGPPAPARPRPCS